MINDLDSEIVKNRAVRCIDRLNSFNGSIIVAFTDAGAFTILVIAGFYEAIGSKSKLDFSASTVKTCIKKIYRSSIFYYRAFLGGCIRGKILLWRSINLCANTKIRTAVAVRKKAIFRACSAGTIVMEFSPQRLC